MAEREYDLIALGGGAAGLVTASGAAYLGASVALVEKGALGGDCLWTGCVPSKALLASAGAARGIRTAERFGLPPLDVSPCFRTVMERVREARAQVAVHDDPERIRARGIDVQFGAARFIGPGRIDVEGVGVLRSKRIVVATGAAPIVPPVTGLEESGYLTHEIAPEMTELPDSVVILGGGPVGIEYAQIYSRLGASVTVLEQLPEILPQSDPDAARGLRESLEAEGIRFALGSAAFRVAREGELRTVTTEDGRRVSAELLFVATGRRPTTGDLGLDSAGIDTDDGAVRVDNRMRATSRGVWAAGDVTGGVQFTHAAAAMAMTVVRNALLPLSSRADLSSVPRVTFTDPELAEVGLPQAEAERLGGTTFRYAFDDLDRAITDRSTEGFTKITADRRGRILSATVLGRGAGELIAPIVLARKHGLSLADISGTIFPYPTRSEGVRRTAEAFQRARLEGPAGAFLRRVVRWLK